MKDYLSFKTTQTAFFICYSKPSLFTYHFKTCACFIVLTAHCKNVFPKELVMTGQIDDNFKPDNIYWVA